MVLGILKVKLNKFNAIFQKFLIYHYQSQLRKTDFLKGLFHKEISNQMFNCHFLNNCVIMNIVNAKKVYGLKLKIKIRLPVFLSKDKSHYDLLMKLQVI